MTQSSAASLSGKRVLIIGGNGEGIGRAITRAVAAAGAAGVAVNGSNLQRTRAAADEIAASTNAFAAVGNIKDPADVERIITESIAALGGLDVLITNAGGMAAHAPWAPLHRTTDENWDAIFDINLRYVFRAVQLAVRHFVDTGSPGAIVAIGSVAGQRASPMSVAYGAAKAGLISLTRTVAAEYGKRNVRMNVINCGFIQTPASALSTNNDSAQIVAGIPLGRPGRPEDIANFAVFLASDHAAFVTGQSIDVDGGMMLRVPTVGKDNAG